MSYQTLIVEQAGAIATITLNRPEARNALDFTLRREMVAALDEIEANPAARVMVLTGAGGHFCAGGDVKTMRKRHTAAEGRGRVELLNRMVQRLVSFPLPTIAMVEGYAVGAGSNLALCCDLIVASDRAKFGEVFCKIGLAVDGGGTWLLPRLIGMARAKELVFTGEIIDAAEAQRIGLVERVYPHDTLMDEVGPEAVKAAFARDWSGWGPLVAGTTPEPLPQAEILAAIAQPPATFRTAAAPKPPRAPPFAGQAKDLGALYELGRAYVTKRKADKALKAFAGGLAIDPDNGDILNARGNLYLALDRADLAMADFNRALAANPKDDIVLFNRGVADKQLGCNSQALRDFNAVLRLTPGDPATLAGKADTDRQLGDLLLARDFYDAALAADPRNATAWQARGEVRGELGDAAGAEADQAQARKLAPLRGKS